MEGGSFSWNQGSLDEDGHFFDFIAFYKRMEFCDRSIRLEILQECRRVQGPPKEDDVAMIEAPDELGQTSKEQNVTSDKGTQERAENGSGGTAGEGKEQPEKQLEGPSESAKQKASHDAEKIPSEKVKGKMDGLDGVQSESEENMEEVGQEKATRNAETKESGGLQVTEKDEYVEEIPVNSIVLAAKSCVLRTMLSNGMKESDKSAPVVLRVTLEEKEAFKEMLHFMYAGSLSTRFQDPGIQARLLLDLLLVGDKFQVGSFMGAVLKALSERKRSVLDSIVLAVEIPETLEQHPQIKGVVTKARGHLLETFKDVEKWDTLLDFLTLRQGVIEFLLQSEDLEAPSEEKIFWSVVTWAQNNDSGMGERQQAMLGLSKHIRFGCMRGEVLKNALALEEMALPECRERVMQGIYFQAYSDDMKLKSMNVACRQRRGIQNAYFEIVCNFKLDEAGTLVHSPQAEWLDKLWSINMKGEKREGKPSSLGLYLNVRAKEPEAEFKSIRVFYTFHIRKWPSGYWGCIGKVDRDFKQPEGFGYADILQIPWEEIRKSEKYVGKTGEVTVKVIARKL